MKSVITIFLLLLTTSVRAHYYVVCVGMSDYPGRQDDLWVSANDAKTIQKLFSANGHSSVVCLVNEKATVAAVKRTMAAIFGKANANDAVLFFFSGHGMPGGLVCFDGFLHYSEVATEMKRSKARTKIVMADACYAGKMRNNGKSGSTTNTDDQNIMYFLSSRTNEKSLETKYANSLFTIFLERGLRGGADANRDRVITAKELFDFVHTGVVRESINHQHPVMWGRFDQNMSVIKW